MNDLRWALEKALTQPPPAGEEQRAYIKAHYSWEEVVDENLDLYRGSGI